LAEGDRPEPEFRLEDSGVATGPVALRSNPRTAHGDTIHGVRLRKKEEKIRQARRELCSAVTAAKPSMDLDFGTSFPFVDSLHTKSDDHVSRLPVPLAFADSPKVAGTKVPSFVRIAFHSI